MQSTARRVPDCLGELSRMRALPTHTTDQDLEPSKGRVLEEHQRENTGLHPASISFQDVAGRRPSCGFVARSETVWLWAGHRLTKQISCEWVICVFLSACEPPPPYPQ